MAETQLSNAIVPEVFSGYTVEPSIYKSRFFGSGALAVDNSISSLLSGGGKLYDLPFWQDVGGTSGDIPGESGAATVNNLAAAKQVFRKQVRNKVWGSNDLVTVFAGSDPMDALVGMVNGYWAEAYDQISFATIRGFVAKNIATNSSDLFNDISGATGSAAYFSYEGVIDAQGKLGENGVIGSTDNNNGGFAAIVVHPKTYSYMRKISAIDYTSIAGQELPVETFMGMRVIVDRNAYVNSTVYDSYIVKNGALRFGQTSVGFLPTEIDRDASTGFGIDKLYTRRTFAIHPLGMTWADTSVSGVSPSDAEIYAATNWTRAFNAENCGVVALRHKLG